jgi:O-Antigen ligase
MMREVFGRHLCRRGRDLLLLLAVALPFEAPLFRLGPIQITTVELVLYATLATWLASVALDGFLFRPSRWWTAIRGADGLTQGATLFAAATFVSAFAAPSPNAAPMKFALRTLSGILLFFCARSLLWREDARPTWRAIVLGSLLSAFSAVLDRLWPSTAWLWTPFREGSFAALGLHRASGVFGYPTIGAMYWEATAPLLVVMPFLSCTGGRSTPPHGVRWASRTWGELGVVFGSALLVGAILASATRSGLAGTAVACAALIALDWRQTLGVRRASAVALVVTLLFGTGPVLFGSLLGQRMLFWQDARWFKVAYRVGELPATIHVGEAFSVVVTVTNASVLPWKRTQPGVTHLSYHWGCPAGGYRSLADFEGVRSGLPADVPPGGTVDVVAVVRGPEAPGEYRLSWDLVQEDVSWFSERGSPTADQLLVVEPLDTREGLDSPGASERLSSGTPGKTGDCPSMAAEPAPPPRRELWRAAVVLWRSRPLLGIGPDNFRHRYESIVAPSPNGEPYSDTRLHANSLYFETLADLGLAGLLALGWIGVGLLRCSRRHWRTGYLAGLGTAVAAAAFFVHGALDYFFEFTPLLCLFWLLLGLTATSPPESRAALQGSTP